jgi:hypothetical protein
METLNKPHKYFANLEQFVRHTLTWQYAVLPAKHNIFMSSNLALLLEICENYGIAITNPFEIKCFSNIFLTSQSYQWITSYTTDVGNSTFCLYNRRQYGTDLYFNAWWKHDKPLSEIFQFFSTE